MLIEAVAITMCSYAPVTVNQEPRLLRQDYMYITEEQINYSSIKVSNNEKLKKNFEQLKIIKTLKKNWNGNGADPIPTEIINKVRGLLCVLDENQPEIFPTACDSIQIEYEKDNGEYLEFEFLNNNMVKWFHVDKNSKETYGEYEYDVDTIKRMVDDFCE